MSANYEKLEQIITNKLEEIGFIFGQTVMGRTGVRISGKYAFLIRFYYDRLMLGHRLGGNNFKIVKYSSDIDYVIDSVIEWANQYLE